MTVGDLKKGDVIKIYDICNDERIISYYDGIVDGDPTFRDLVCLGKENTIQIWELSPEDTCIELEEVLFNHPTPEDKLKELLPELFV